MFALSEFIRANSIRGFLDEQEGEALYELALSVAGLGPCLEIGSYCGKSTVYLGGACKQVGNTLYAVDHHRGSEEHQRGEAYHDPDLFDEKFQHVDSFPLFRHTLALAALEETVVPLVAPSAVVARHWRTPLGLVFVDGGHSHESAMQDCQLWSERLLPGGLLAVHDLFEHPEDGGQGPFLAFTKILQTGAFERVAQIESLGVLRKK